MIERILILPSWYPSDLAPISGIFVQEQALALSQKYQVAVLMPNLVGWRELLRGRVGVKSQVEKRAGIKVYRQRALAPIPQRVLGLAYQSYVQAARRGFQTVLATWGKPDVIHAHVVLPAGWAAVKLGKQYDIPVVLTEHSSPFSMHLKTRRQQRLTEETLAQVSCVVAVSPAMARQIHAFHQAVEINVVGNLIKTRFFVPLENSRESSRPTTRFLSIGLLTAQKGLGYLLEAARLLAHRGFTSFELAIGGDGPDRAKLERMARAFGLAGQCHFLGMLTPAEVRSWMQQCDVFVLPSLHETFGIVLGEAMACGKPVISTRCGGPEFVVTPDTGILVDIENPVALADAMEKLSSGRFKYDSRLIRQSVTERFGEETFLRNISGIYERVWARS